MNVTIAGIQYNQHCLDNDSFTVDLNITLSQESILNQTDSSGKVTTIFHLKKLHKSKLNQIFLKQRLSTSYLIAEHVSKRTGFSQMIDFIILNKERTIQKSVFANNVNDTCDFGEFDFKCDNNVVLPLLSVMIQSGELPKNKGKGKNKEVIIPVVVIVMIVVFELVDLGVFRYI